MLKKMLSVIMAASMILSAVAFSMTSASAESNSPQITGVTGYAESEDPSRVMGDAVDGNTETFWHTKFNSNEVNFETNAKNSYYLDLGAEYVVDKFEYVPKQKADKNGKITDFELYGTLDTDRETAQWTLIDTVNGWTYGTAGEGMESHTLEIADPQAWRMLKITVKGSTKNDGDPNSFICAAEFKVYGTEYQAETPVWETTEGGPNIAVTKYNGTDVNVVIPETIGENTVTGIGSAFGMEKVFADAYASGVQIESIVMPDTVKNIRQQAVYGIASLKTVKFSNNLEQIYMEAFRDCSSLEVVDLPATLVDIGNNAFTGCSNLKTIIIRGENTTISGMTSASSASFGFEDGAGKEPIEGITIVGIPGSNAEKFANKFGMTFISLEDYEGGTIIGDVNEDGVVDINDATLVQEYIVGISVDNFNADLADVNGDEEINIYDVTAIQLIINKAK